MNTQDIEIKAIRSKENIRVKIGKNELVGLMETIKQHGLQQPIGVVKVGNKFNILYGHRRLEACKKLQWTTIPAIVHEEAISKEYALILNAIENVQRKDISLWELGRIGVKLSKKMSGSEMAAMLGVSHSKVQDAIKAYRNTPIEARSKIDYIPSGQKRKKGIISASTARGILSMGYGIRLAKKELIQLLEKARLEEWSTADIEIISLLIGNGMNMQEAIKRKHEFVTLRALIVINKDTYKEVKDKYNIPNNLLCTKIVYGVIPPFKLAPELKTIQGE